MTNDRNQTDELLLWPLAQKRLGGISRQTCYRLRDSDPTFPKAIRISPMRVVYRASEIDAWVDAQAEKSAAR